MSIKNGHVRWAFDLDAWKRRCTPNDLKLATSCIQPEEKERLARFVYRNDFNASIIGRLLMRKFINMCTELEYNKIHFERDSRGKPFLKQSTDQISHIDFNVSHHDQYAVLAGTYVQNPSISNVQQHIGVDIMKAEYSSGKALSEFFRIMQRTFTPSEWNFIKSRSTEQQQAAAFMRHWSLKESYVKNIGVGITIDLQSISFRLNTDSLSTTNLVQDTVVVVDGKADSNWVFEESLLSNDHCVAVAIKNPMPEYSTLPSNELLFELIDFETLMKDAVPLLPEDPYYCQRILQKEYKSRITI